MDGVDRGRYSIEEIFEVDDTRYRTTDSARSFPETSLRIRLWSVDKLSNGVVLVLGKCLPLQRPAQLLLILLAIRICLVFIVAPLLISSYRRTELPHFYKIHDQNPLKIRFRFSQLRRRFFPNTSRVTYSISLPQLSLNEYCHYGWLDRGMYPVSKLRPYSRIHIVHIENAKQTAPPLNCDACSRLVADASPQKLTTRSLESQRPLARAHLPRTTLHTYLHCSSTPCPI